MNRREFLRLSALGAGAFAFPSVIVPRAWGQRAPSDQLTFGFVGVGGMGGANIERVLSLRSRGARILAVCDVDLIYREGAAAKVNGAQATNDCAAYNDFRDLTRRTDIDAVIISTPDHWHALPAIDAIRHGKDVYVEKPLTLTVREGQVLVKELRRHQRIGQTGTQQRSDKDFRLAAEVIRNGRLGKLERIEVLIPANNKHCPGTWTPEPVPEGLDYDFWLGPAPWAPYTPQRTHYQFRFILDTAGGQTTNWGAHYLDIAQWALGTDDTGPVEIEGHGEFPDSGLFTAPRRVEFIARYANGVPLHCRTRTDGIFDGNIIFHGDREWLNVSRSELVASDPAILQDAFASNEVRLYRSDDHMGNFLDCIRSRKQPVSDLAVGHKTTNICNIANIAMMLRRKLVWDPAKESFQDDQQANRMLSRAMRGSWSLA